MHAESILSEDARFWSRVDATGDCWEWRGGRTKGYGHYHPLGTGVTLLAHRYAYESLVGMIPLAFGLDHLCRNHACVNPDHLEPVTHAENMRRGANTGRGEAPRKTHCVNGHPYSDENTRAQRRADGTIHRRCRVCERERQKQRYWQRQGASV